MSGLKLAHQLLDVLKESDKPLKLPVARFFVALARHKNGATLHDLETECGIGQTHASRYARQLDEEFGYVKRYTSPDDSRYVMAELTHHGRLFAEKIDRIGQ